MAARRRTFGSWSELFITSSLAAAIATFGSFITDRGKVSQETAVRRCEIAQAFLSDETPSPYMGAVTRQAVTREAAVALTRCLKER